MGIITRSYFEKGETMIANVLDLAPNSDLLGNGVSIEVFIARYERDILTRLFGYDLYSEFVSQFDIDPVTDLWTLKAASVGTKWDWLLNGYEYTKDGAKVKWQGLIFSEGGSANELKQSLIAYYVYSKYIEATAFQNAGIGMVADQGKNSVRVDANADVALATNDFFALAIGYYDYSIKYYDGCFSWLVTGSGYRSLYNFLEDMNQEDPLNFPAWQPGVFKLKNRFGL